MRALLLGVVAALVILGAREASAFRVFGFKADPPVVTYDHPMIGAAVRAWAEHAWIVDGGMSSEPLISGRVPNPWEWGYNVAGVAIPVAPGGILASCRVEVNPRAADWLAVWVHEVGHCLGLAHSERPDAMMSEWCCNPISEDDIRGIQALYGPPRLFARLTVPGLARD